MSNAAIDVSEHDAIAKTVESTGVDRTYFGHGRNFAY